MTLLYFDPGLGAMIAQGLVAIVAGVVLFSKNALFKIKSMLGLIKEDTYEGIDIDEIDTDEDDK